MESTKFPQEQRNGILGKDTAELWPFPMNIVNEIKKKDSYDNGNNIEEL